MNDFSSMRLSECYRLLWVSPGIGWREIKKSYHDLAKKFHPDANPGDPENELRFKEISQAYKILELHFQSLNSQKKPDLEPTSDSFRRVMEDEFETPQEPQPEKKFSLNPLNPLIVTLSKNPKIRELAFRVREVLTECEKKIFLLDIDKDIQIDSETASKGGMVRVRRGKENFQVQIPSGTWKRMSLRIPDKGESSLFGKRRGDLILNIHVLPGNEVCEGDTNFFYDLQISRGNIEKGRVQSLETVQGNIKFVLPKPTRHGQSFVLKARTSSDAVLRTNHVVTVQLI